MADIVALVAQDRINELMLKLQAAEAAAQQGGILQSKNQELDTVSVESSLKAKAREQEIEKHKSTVAELEKKVRVGSHAILSRHAETLL